MRNNIFEILIFALWATSVSQASLAQLYERGDENLVLPDEFYISARCEEPIQRLEWVREDKRLLDQVDIKSAESVAGEMSSICDKVKKREVLPDAWVIEFERLGKSLESLTDACGRTVMCKKMFIPPPKPIPNNFSAYSLFLFPSSEWSKPELQAERYKIRAAFSDFGDSIGNKRAAIWFSTSFNSSTPDVQRSKYFADTFKLNYNDGPFVVTSLKRPDALAKNDEIVVIKLGGINPDRIVKVLNLLEKDLRTDADIRKRTLIFEEIKQRLLSVIDRNPEIAKEITKTAISVLTK